jgi:hypothetical protein
MKSMVLRSFKKAHVIGMFVLAVGFLATLVLMPSESIAQDARVAKSMAALKDQTSNWERQKLMEKMRSAAGMLLLCISARPK